MQRRGLVLFIIVNVLISATVAFLVISLGGDSDEGGADRERLVTFEVIITATPDPNETPRVVVVTATFDPDNPASAGGAGPQVDLPPDVIAGNAAAGTPPPTVDPAALDANPELADLPPNCLPHVVDSGENPSLIAEQYGANLFELLTVNGLTEETATGLQIGDILIVPLEGCELLSEPIVVGGEEDDEGGSEDDADADEETGAEAEATEEPDATPTITPTPTITLPPTATTAQIEILSIGGRGDITTEEVVLLNNGATVVLTGWTLQDTNGNVYEFPDGQSFFSQAELRVRTRAGAETPIIKYWGLDEAVFGEPGDAILLLDDEGVAQAVLRLDE